MSEQPVSMIPTRFSFIRFERYLLVAFFLVPAVVSALVFARAGHFHGRYATLPAFLFFSALLATALSHPTWRRGSALVERLYRGVPFLCFMVSIFFMSSLRIPPKTSPLLPDYVYHFSEYAALGFLCVRMVAGDERESLRLGPFLWAFAFCLVYAGLDELHQSGVPTRTASPKDFLVDIAGVLIGMLGYRLLSAGISGERETSSGNAASAGAGPGRNR